MLEAATKRRRSIRKTYALVLSLLAFAFFLRVLGQALVVFGEVTFLPPMEAWQSGLLPYPLLLLSQLIILGVQVKISYDLWSASGFFMVRRPVAGMVLRRLSYVYFLVMVLRYIITLALYPDRRWFTGTIPIWFHFVLAGYLFMLGRFLARDTDDVIDVKSHP